MAVLATVIKTSRKKIVKQESNHAIMLYKGDCGENQPENINVLFELNTLKYI